VLRPLEVRAIVFESAARRVAIATLDVVGVTRETTARIRRVVEQARGIPASGVMVLCSHTHCAPATLPCLGLSPSAEWLERIEGEVAACIERAARGLSPVRLGLGSGEAHFNQSRRPSSTREDDACEPVDRRVRVLRVDRLDGSILATFFHYSCHPTVVSGLEGFVSPDYPGVARDVIDAAGGTSLFFPGCGGDLRPAVDIETSDARSRLDRCGRLLGEEVCRVVASIDTRASAALHAARAEIELPFGDPLPAERLRELMTEPTELGRRLTGPWARKVLRLVETGSLPRARQSEMQAMTIGPLTCVGIPGEPLQAVGRALEERVGRCSDARDVWPVGYANDQIGYFCTERQYAEGGYEPTAYGFYDQPAPFSGEERVIVDSAVRLVGDRSSSPSDRPVPGAQRGDQDWTGIEE
jgi:neutral ceramidase